MQKDAIVRKKGLAYYYATLMHHAVHKEYWLVLTATIMLFAMSQISIPLQPVPITMQTVAVMLIGLTCQRATAIKAVGTYLLLGMAGAPVFANFHGGYASLIGPTGGYLIGFLFAVWLMTSLRGRLNYRHFFPALLGSLLGTIAIFAVGILWLSAFIGWKMALQGGLYPFLVPGVLKALFLAATLRLALNLPWRKSREK